jgi:hypothetical protein
MKQDFVTARQAMHPIIRCWTSGVPKFFNVAPKNRNSVAYGELKRACNSRPGEIDVERF